MEKTDYYGICKQKMKYLNYSERTIDTYLNYINKFLKHSDIPPSRFTAYDFQNYLDNFNFTSISQQNQIINAIRFLYKYGLERKYDKVTFHRPRKEKHLPQVIDGDFLIKRLSEIKNIKHKAILSLAFSVGLRVSEVINLKIADIDSARMLIHIKNAKGHKDRVTPLSEYMLKLLREYYKEYRPKEYMFNGQISLQYSSDSCNQIMKRYISPDSHFHQLRHSSFTTMLENGTDLRIIQKIAGHNSSRTTEIYTHVSNNLLSKVKLAI